MSDKSVFREALSPEMTSQSFPMSRTVKKSIETINFQPKRLLPNTYILCPYLKCVERDAQPRPQKKTRPFGMSYLIDENPPWYICVLLGFQVRGVNVVPVFLSKGKVTVLTSSSRDHR